MPAKSAATKPAAAKPAATKPADAVKLLTEDHKEVRALFKAFDKLSRDEDADDEEKEALARRICSLLTVHTQLEEELFYPAAREAIEAQDLLDEATVEHASAKDLIAQLDAMSADGDLFDAKVTVLGEYVDHHIKEEEAELFPKLKNAELDLGELGVRMVERKQALMDERGLAES